MSETAQLYILGPSTEFLFFSFFFYQTSCAVAATDLFSTLIAWETGGSVWEVLYQRSHVVVTPRTTPLLFLPKSIIPVNNDQFRVERKVPFFYWPVL